MHNIPRPWNSSGANGAIVERIVVNFWRQDVIVLALAKPTSPKTTLLYKYIGHNNADLPYVLIFGVSFDIVKYDVNRGHGTQEVWC